MNTQLVDMNWPHSYEAELPSGLPSGGAEALDFRATPQGRGREGLVARIWHGPTVWIGNFQRGDGKLSGLYATPSPDCLCVVAGGQAYWIPVLAPARYKILRADSCGITGQAWDATQEREVGFFIEPETGRVEGGAAPPVLEQ